MDYTGTAAAAHTECAGLVFAAIACRRKLTEPVDNFVGKSVRSALEAAPIRSCDKSMKF